MNISSRKSKAASLRGSVSHPNGDALFRIVTKSATLFTGLLIFVIVIVLTFESRLSIGTFGLKFLLTDDWDPVAGKFGALSSAYGTIISTLLAMSLAVPLSLAIALFLVETAPPRVSVFFSTAIELLAAIPSIIYGMWGLFVFAPIMSNHIQPLLGEYLGFLPLFQGPPMGIGMLTAGLILALMVLPFITAVTRDVFKMVPTVVKEAAYGIGATSWEVTRGVTFKYSLRGIVGACFLGLGRALGETMAVTFVIGNSHHISASLFAPGNSIASTLANEFSEAAGELHLSALVGLGLVLLLLSTGIQFLAQIWLKAFAFKRGKR